MNVQTEPLPKNEINQYENNFYRDAQDPLERSIQALLDKLETIRTAQKKDTGRDPVEYCKARIKSPESMKNKLLRRGYASTLDNALTVVSDAAGIRVICTFVDDVYTVANLIAMQNSVSVIHVKDYIKSPKANGYRSYHMIVAVAIPNDRGMKKIRVEIQIRTLAMDCWASLEHQLKYKQNIENQAMIVDELKRCADEIASTDLTMQTIRELINATTQEED